MELKIGLGTAAIGRPQYINLRQEKNKEFSIEHFKNHGLLMLDEAYQKGIRYFDTAPGYGLAEQLLIDWIQEKKYDDVEIATKWGYSYVANFNPRALIHEVKDHSLSMLKQQWKHSKKLFPHLSSYQIHSLTLDSGILKDKEVLGYLGELKDEYGLKIGLTTSGAKQLDVLRKSLDVMVGGNALFDVFQVTYNILDQSLARLSNMLISMQKRIVIKEALANGRIFPNPHYSNYSSLHQQLQILASKYEVGIDAIALSFCQDMIQPFVVLSGASTERQISENLKVNSFQLEEAELSALQQYAVDPDYYWLERKQMKWN